MPVYEKRRAVVKAIAKFWPVALMNHGMLALHVQHNSDQAALSYLEDLWIVRDPVESRCFTLEFVSTALYCGNAGGRTEWRRACSRVARADEDVVWVGSTSRRTRTFRTRS